MFMRTPDSNSTNSLPSNEGVASVSRNETSVLNLLDTINPEDTIENLSNLKDYYFVNEDGLAKGHKSCVNFEINSVIKFLKEVSHEG